MAVGTGGQPSQSCDDAPIAEGSVARLKMLRRCSKSEAPHSPSPDRPWRYDAVSDNVVGPMVFDFVKDYDSGAPPHL